MHLGVRTRKAADEAPAGTVSTNVPFELVVTWGDGRSSTVQVEKSGSVKLNQ